MQRRSITCNNYSESALRHPFGAARVWHMSATACALCRWSGGSLTHLRRRAASVLAAAWDYPIATSDLPRELGCAQGLQHRHALDRRVMAGRLATKSELSLQRTVRGRRDRDKDVASATCGYDSTVVTGATLRDSTCRHVAAAANHAPCGLSGRQAHESPTVDLCRAGSLPTRWLTAASS